MESDGAESFDAMESDGVDSLDDIKNTASVLRTYLEIIKNVAVYLVEQKYGVGSMDTT